MNKNMKITNNKIIVAIVILAAVLCFSFGIYWILYLQKAHSTFENYYNFRGCVQLVSKTDNYGFCKISSGQTIKIVRFHDKWYLDGDLPCGFLCF
jgi:hypothetical protein